MRLGLAVGDLSLVKVMNLPYPLYKRWKIFYLLEPFGFADAEYRTAALLAQINNSSATKRSQLQKVTRRMRDMPKELLKYIRATIKKQSDDSSAPDLDTPEGKQQAAELVVRNFEQMFGKRVERKDKKK